MTMPAMPLLHLGVDNGLSNGYVTDITEDGRGNIWVATEEGLNRWDGKRFHRYTPVTSGLTDPELSCLLHLDEDNDHLWVGSQRNGIFRVDLRDYSISRPEEELYSYDISSLSPGRNGGMWVTQYHFGPQFYDPAKGIVLSPAFTSVPGLPKRSWEAYEGANGKLYIGHVDEGFSVADTIRHTFVNYRYPDIPGNSVYTITPDNNGNLWLGTNHGAALFNPTTGEITKMVNDPTRPESINPGAIRSITVARDGELWFGTSQGGISILSLNELSSKGIEGAQFTSLPTDNAPGGTSGTIIRSIFRDSYNNIWIGNYSSGVDFAGHIPGLVTRVNYMAENGSDRNLPVWCATSDKNGNVWFGGNTGIACADRNGNVLRRIPLKYGNSAISSYIRSICYDPDYGRIWAGTNENGLFIYSTANGRWEKAGIPPYTIRGITILGDSICVSTDHGLYRIPREGSEAEPAVKINTHLNDLIINNIIANRGGSTWVAGFGKGLYVFGSDMELQSHFEGSTFPSNQINALVEDNGGSIWAATMRGLVRFDSKDINDWHTIGSIDRLGISHIYSLAEDNDGHIWFTTSHGIGILNPDTEECTVYAGDGNTPLHSFIAGPAAVTDGIISFPSINGLIQVNTEFIVRNETPSNIHTTSVKVIPDGPEKPFDNGNVWLSAGENNFAVTFTIPDYSLMTYTDFSYQLKGLDTDWTETMGDNTITFRNIPPSKYHLLVRHRNGLSWSEPKTILTITVAPPLWLSWWAKLAYFIIFLLIIAGTAFLIRRRLARAREYRIEKERYRNSQELNEERLRFYTNVTHELRTPLTLITGPLEDIVSDPSLPHKFAYKLRMMRSNAEQLMTLINGILEFRKTETVNRRLAVRFGKPANLLREIGLRFKESTRNPNLKFTFDIEADAPEMYFDNDILTIILNNLLSNAVKYTDKGEIRLSMHTSTGADGIRRTVISVSDTGYGISEKAKSHIFERYYQANGEHQTSGTGIGLALVKNLVDLHHAEISVESKEGKGSTFSLSLLTDEKYPEALHFSKNEPKKPAEEAANEVMNRERRKILIVEDNADIRDYINVILQDEYEVITAVNGLDGLEKAHTHMPDIIISDIMMPEMDGVNMTRQLKNDEMTSHIPIILLTAKDSLTDKEEGYESGADSYLTKPFSAKLLLARISNIIMARKRLAEFLFKTATPPMPQEMQEQQQESPMEEESAAEEITASLSPLDAHFLDKLNSILESTLSDDSLNVAMLADRMCMSNSTLYRKIMSLLGVSPNEYIRRIRLAKATELLLARELTIAEIAYRTGFGSYNSFSKVFKKEYGLSPTEYQNQATKNNV